MKNDNWISCEERLPPDSIHCVLITDGEFIALGQYIHDPKNYYEPEDLKEFEEEWKEPHWNLENTQGIYKGIDIYFSCCLGDISHWMPWPKTPNDIKIDLTK